jgi:hypothetical protein
MGEIRVAAHDLAVPYSEMGKRVGSSSPARLTDSPFFVHLISPRQLPSKVPTTRSFGTCLILVNLLSLPSMTSASGSEAASFGDDSYTTPSTKNRGRVIQL